MNLIDKDDFINKIIEDGYFNKYQIDLLQNTINTMPTEDIVRCKDCKYSYTMMTARSKDGQERWTRFCDKHKNWYPKDDWFCKDGEGKEE